MTTRTETQSLSTTTARRPRISQLLLLDAGVSGLNGLAYLAGAALLDGLLGPSVLTLEILGVVLLVWAAALTWIGTRDPVPPGLVREVVIGNLVWVAGSIAVAFGLLSLTGVGLAWCLLQAVVVAGFAVSQHMLQHDDRR